MKIFCNILTEMGQNCKKKEKKKQSTGNLHIPDLILKLYVCYIFFI